ncbi:hypothetical protein NFJ02_25g57980 [Pycnococcus provasolii]
MSSNDGQLVALRGDSFTARQPASHASATAEIDIPDARCTVRAAAAVSTAWPHKQASEQASERVYAQSRSLDAYDDDNHNDESSRWQVRQLLHAAKAWLASGAVLTKLLCGKGLTSSYVNIGPSTAAKLST